MLTNISAFFVLMADVTVSFLYFSSFLLELWNNLHLTRNPHHQH